MISPLWFVGSSRRFAAHVWVFGSVVAVASYLPLFAGRAPFPADIFRYYPLWEEHTSGPLPGGHAELGDLLTLMYPWRHFLQASLSERTLPFWNPYAFAGAPFLANPISAVFYPPNWLYFALPVKVAWSIQFPIRMGLAFVFAALLSRRIGASPRGALAGGAVFSMCGFMIGWQGWPQADVMLWAPLGMLAVLGVRRRPGLRSSAFLALALAMPVLAGHPEVCLYTLSASAAFALFNLGAALTQGRRTGWAARYVGGVLLGATLASGVCAVQLVPTAEWLPRITRGLTASWQPQATRDAVAFVSRDSRSQPNSSGLSVPDESCYPGMATLLLAPLALLRRRKGHALFFASLALFCAAVAFGVGPPSAMFRSVPVLRSLPGTRVLGLCDLSLALLAALGLAQLEDRRSKRASLVAALAVGAAAAAAAAALAALSHRVEAPLAPTRSPAFSAWLLAAAGALIVVALCLRRTTGVVVPMITALVAVDVATFSWRHVPVVEAAEVYPMPPAVEFLKAHLREGQRVLFLDRTAPANAGMVFGFETIDGYPQVLRRTAALMAPLNGGTRHDDPLKGFTLESILAADRGVLNALGLRFLVSNGFFQSEASLSRFGEVFPLRYSRGSIRIFENTEALPRVFVQAARDEARLTDPPCRVAGVEIGPDRVAGRAVCDGPGLLVLSETFYPGWRATVRGGATQVRPTADSLCAVALPAGESQFEVRFRPTLFGLAAAGSVCGAVIAVGLLVVKPSRFRRAT